MISLNTLKQSFGFEEQQAWKSFTVTVFLFVIIHKQYLAKSRKGG